VSAPGVALARPHGLRLPPRDSAVWLAVAPVAALAAAGLLLWLLGVPGGDDPAHLYKIMLLREGQSVVWDNFWYGGSYGAITYGVVYYWLAEWIPGPVIVALAGGLLPWLFHLHLRRTWAVPSRAPAWALAAILVLYLAWGQSPFLLALCLSMAGVVLLGRGRPLLAALPLAVAVFTNPLGLLAGGVFVLADLVAHRESRRAIGLLALALVPVVVARVALAAVFAAPSWELHLPAELAGLLAFAALGVLLARTSGDATRRPLQWVFIAFAVVILPAYLVPGLPLGSGAGRFFYVFGAPLLLAVAWPTRLPRWAPAAALAVALAFQIAFPLWLLARVPHLPATRAAFFAPALRVADRLYDPGYRYHVVTPERHWEAYYFPAAGYAITRGWYRQADALHNRELYDASLTAPAYTAWLRRMGVRYVFLPHAPLVAQVRREAGILERSAEFSVVYRDASWTVYRLAASRPIVVPLAPHAAAQVLTLDHTTTRFAVPRPGIYRIKLTWSPYWLLARRPDAVLSRGRDGLRERQWETDATAQPRSVLRPDADGFTLFVAPAAGLYTLRFDATRAAEEELLP
jgi:hypothetical protein